MAKIKQTLYLSEEANEMWNELSAAQPTLNRSQIFEQIVRELFSQRGGIENPDANCQKKNNDMSELLNVIKTIENETNKNTFYILDILNSLITSGISVPDVGYVSIEDKPHLWLKKSKDTLSAKIYNRQQSKFVKEG
jgi:hypothetical protein